MKVHLDPQARDDLREIRSYLAGNAGPAAADRVQAHLRSRIEKLGDHPHIGIRTSDPDIRVLAPTRYPYRIYYTVTPAAVVILHVRHTARQAPDLGRP